MTLVTFRVVVVSFKSKEVAREEHPYLPVGLSLVQERLVPVNRGVSKADHIHRHLYLLLINRVPMPF